MTFQYGGMRETICPPQYSPIAGNLSTANTLYFWLQGRNDVGYNLPSEPVTTVTYSANSGIRLTLPGDCLRSGENILQYSLSVNTVNDPSSAKVLVSLNQDDITLPHNIDLTEDSHLLIEESVTTLPTGVEIIPGMLRQLISTGLIYRYEPSSTLTPNGTTVLAATPDSGNWVSFYDGFSSYVGNTAEDTNGANLNVLDIINGEAIISKSYSLDGSAGPERVYWIRNDTTETITQGTRVGLTVSVNGEPASEEFESLIKITFDGYVDPSTGTLDIVQLDGVTPMDGVGIVKDYQFGRTDLILQKPLEPNQAYQITVFPQFNSYELQSIPLTGTNISVLGFFFDEAGAYNDASALIGNIMLPENPGLRRVYPSSGLSVFADEGSGTVGGFFFKDIGSNVIPGLIDNTPAQTIAINNNGSTYLTNQALSSNEDLRALVSTVAGESITTAFTQLGVTGDGSPDITVTVDYPNEIDPVYDDVIAGAVDKGTFNAEEIALYIRKGGSEIRKFSGLAPTNVVQDDFTVSWANGTVVTGVQTQEFGLWNPILPETVVTSTSGGTVYEVAVGFVYLGNSVTGISHKEADGVIAELGLSIADLSEIIVQLQEATDFWKEPVSSYASLRDKPVSALRNGQSNRVETETQDEYEIWTWVETSTRITDDVDVIRPTEYANDATAGRWIRISGGGEGTATGGTNADNIVTYLGQVVVGPDGYIVTSELGGPITPGSQLDDYLESNITGLSRNSLTSNITLTEQSNKYQVVTNTNSTLTIFLYDGGSIYGREHLIRSKNSTSDINIEYNGSILDTITSNEQIQVLWDTEEWLIL